MDLVYKSEESDASEALIAKPDLEQMATLDEKAKRYDEAVTSTDN